MDKLIELTAIALENDVIEIIFKLVLISVLAGIVGYERESWNKPAGFRTNVLVGLSGMLVMICGFRVNEKMGGDPSRIPAQLLSGIGFIGAGTIMRDGFNVKGLTTAAALLAITCIGLLVGGGFYLEAILSTVVVYFILSYSHIIADSLEHMNFLNLEINASDPKNTINEIKAILDGYKLELRHVNIKEIKDGDSGVIKIEAKSRDAIKKNVVISELMQIDSVSSISEFKNNDE